MSVLPPPVRHPDRSVASLGTSLALTVATATATAVAGQSVAQGRLTSTTGVLAGASVGVLAVVGLPSVSIRLVSRVLLALSAAVLVRFGVLSGGVSTGGQFVVLWLAAAVTVLVLTDRIDTDATPALEADGDDGPGPRRAAGVARTVVVVAAAVVAFALVAGPALLPLQDQATQAGEGASLDALPGEGSTLRASSSLDMTRRPALTDEVVFTVDSNRATFWRGQTFDLWDGRTWTRSEEEFRPLLPGDRLRIAEDDLGARGSDVVRQRFRMQAPYADVVYAAPSAVEVEIDRPLRQRDDGTLISAPLGRGATYTVTSRREVLTEDRLRGLDPAEVPASVIERFAQPPQATERVLQAATEVTEGITGTYDKIIALQDWMGSRVEYSLDAPLAPRGRDVVDHFLFDAEQGWCEQVASSLVVLARANQIPARLVTGFVPGDRDPVTGVFTVRARDAHAWTEVWFPEVGWVSFDPTANVPLAGSDAPDPTLGRWLVDHAIFIALGIAVLVVLGGPVRRVLVRWWSRRRQRPVGWAAVTDRRLDALGARVGRPRQGHQTATAYAAVLADRYRDPRLHRVGAAVDRAVYAARRPSAEDEAAVDAVLDELFAAPVPEPAPDPDPDPVSAQ